MQKIDEQFWRKIIFGNNLGFSREKNLSQKLCFVSFLRIIFTDFVQKNVIYTTFTVFSREIFSTKTKDPPQMMETLIGETGRSVPPPFERFKIGLLHMTLSRNFTDTVESFYSGHHWFLQMLSAIERCPLYRGAYFVRVSPS